MSSIYYIIFLQKMQHPYSLFNFIVIFILLLIGFAGDGDIDIGGDGGADFDGDADGGIGIFKSLVTLQMSPIKPITLTSLPVGIASASSVTASISTNLPCITMLRVLILMAMLMVELVFLPLKV